MKNTHPCTHCKESGYCTKMCKQWYAWFADRWSRMHRDAERLIKMKKTKEAQHDSD